MRMPRKRHHSVRISATDRQPLDLTRNTARAKTESFIAFSGSVRASVFNLLRVHFVDLAVQCPAADSEPLRRSGDISFRCGESLHDKALLGLVKIERALSCRQTLWPG